MPADGTRLPFKQDAVFGMSARCSGAASSQGVTATTCRRHLPIDSLAENISWAIMNLLNRDPGNIDPDSQFVKDWEKDYKRWCARVSAKLGNKFRWSVEMKQALASVVCCSSPTPSNISNLNSAASVACISGRMPTRSTVAIIGNRFEKFRHCQALSAVARPSWMVLDLCKRRLKARKNKRNREECQ